MATAPPPANICICQAFYCKSQKLLGFPCDSAGKESTCNAGDLRSIPGLGRSPGKGKGYPLQYSGLENSMGCIVHGAAKSQTRLSSFHFPRSPNPATHTPPTPLPVLAQPPPSIPKDQEGRTGEVVGTYPWFRRPPFPKTGVSLMTLLGVAPQTPQAVEATYATLLGGRSGRHQMLLSHLYSTTWASHSTVPLVTVVGPAVSRCLGQATQRPSLKGPSLGCEAGKTHTRDSEAAILL